METFMFENKNNYIFLYLKLCTISCMNQCHNHYETYLCSNCNMERSFLKCNIVPGLFLRPSGNIKSNIKQYSSLGTVRLYTNENTYGWRGEGYIKHSYPRVLYKIILSISLISHG